MLAQNLGPREDYGTLEVRVFSPAAPGDDYFIELSVLTWRTFPRCKVRIDQANLIALDSDPHAYGRALGRMLFADEALGHDMALDALAVILAPHRGVARQGAHVRFGPVALAGAGFGCINTPDPDRHFVNDDRIAVDDNRLTDDAVRVCGHRRQQQ